MNAILPINLIENQLRSDKNLSEKKIEQYLDIFIMYNREQITLKELNVRLKFILPTNRVKIEYDWNIDKVVGTIIFLIIVILILMSN